MTIDPTPPAPESRPARARAQLGVGLAIGLVVGLALGVLVARNGATDTAESPVTATVTVTAPAPPTVTDPATASPTPDTAPSVPNPAGVPVAPASTDGETPSEELHLTDAIGPTGDLSRRIDGDPLAVGPVDAPVVMVMYSDYRCPFCALFSQTLEPPLVAKYVDAGVMRIEWRDFPIFGEESVRAAVAGRAAGRQGLFWEYNAALYAAAPASGHPELPVKDLVAFAKQVGMPDLDAFRADLGDADLRAAVQADLDEGNSIGVPATPAFVINGYAMRGAQPVDQFEKVIDAVLAAQPPA